MQYIDKMESHSVIKKKANLVICINIDGPQGHYAKWNKSDRERQIFIILIMCGIYKINWTHRNKEQVDSCQRQGVEVNGWNAWRWSKGANFQLYDKSCQLSVVCLKVAGFDPWVRKIPWRREWLPTPVFLPGEFHGRRRLAGNGKELWLGYFHF